MKGWYVEPDCKHCDGTGSMYVMNGPDDVDKDLCYCVLDEEERRVKMGTPLKTYPSQSKPGKVYTIFQPAGGGGEPYCDCWQWKMNKTCKHLEDYLANPSEMVQEPIDVHDPSDDDDIEQAIKKVLGT